MVRHFAVRLTPLLTPTPPIKHFSMLRSPTRSSFPRSQSITPPSSPTKKTGLSMSGVVSIFINLRRLEDNGAKRILLRSGAPKTHPTVADGCRNADTVPVEYSEQYVCKGGVNVVTLLRATRLALLEHCYQIGANALVDEECVHAIYAVFRLSVCLSVILTLVRFVRRWECRISGPKPAPNGAYKVDVRLFSFFLSRPVSILTEMV